MDARKLLTSGEQGPSELDSIKTMHHHLKDCSLEVAAMVYISANLKKLTTNLLVHESREPFTCMGIS